MISAAVNLKQLQMAFGETGYSSDKMSFSLFADFMSLGDICEHRFHEQLEFCFCTSKIPKRFCYERLFSYNEMS